MSDIPVTQQAPPAVERGEAPAYPLGPEFMTLVSGMAATILAGSVALARADLDAEQAAELAVRMSIAAANEVRMYRLIDGKAVRVNNG